MQYCCVVCGRSYQCCVVLEVRNADQHRNQTTEHNSVVVRVFLRAGADERSERMNEWRSERMKSSTRISYSSKMIYVYYCTMVGDIIFLIT
jgi:hypothetical protein